MAKQNKKQTTKTIELTEEQYRGLVKSINKLDDIVYSIREMNDIYLSDVSALTNIKFKLVQALDLDWNSDNYRYETK